MVHICVDRQVMPRGESWPDRSMIVGLPVSVGSEGLVPTFASCEVEYECGSGRFRRYWRIGIVVDTTPALWIEPTYDLIGSDRRVVGKASITTIVGPLRSAAE